jgi:hypothetical protein
MRRSAAKLPVHIAAIALEEGFDVNHRKTRIMYRSDRQSLTGIVINRKLNARRADFDRLKATLTNCARHGPASQNRERVRDFRAHLAGRIAHMQTLNGQRAERLQRIFESIRWEQ